MWQQLEEKREAWAKAGGGAKAAAKLDGGRHLLPEWDDEHNDACVVCDTGGTLLCCDFCNIAQHPKCCDPPMATVTAAAAAAAVQAAAGGATEEAEAAMEAEAADADGMTTGSCRGFDS